MAGLLTPQRQTAGNGLLDQGRGRVDDRVAGLLGLDPSIQRGAILPFGRDASGEMVMAWPEMALDTLKSLMLPGHVVQGGEFTPRDVTEMALDMGMLSSVAPAPAGAKRMFGGISAKNAPLDDLAKAEAMEKAGEAADDIWRATGWGRGAEGKWRFEIDDSQYAETRWPTIDAEPFVAEEGLSQTPYFNHREAIAAYPDLDEKVSVAFGTDKMDGSIPRDGASYGNDAIELGSWTSPKTFVHELQHAVQQREGFARGGSPEYGVTGPIEYPTDLPRWDVLDAADKIRRGADQTGDAPAAVASKYRGAFKIDDESMQQALDFANSPELPAMVERGRGFAEMKPFEAYRRLAGEVEARNVQSRMDMDAATRRATPPWSTEDVPRDQQIVRGLLSGDGPQMSASDGSYKGGQRNVSVENQGNGLFRVNVDGNSAGTISVARDGAGDFVSAAALDEPFQGAGIGRDAYDQIEREIGRQLAPSPLGLSPNATRFWKKRLAEMPPEARADVLRRSRDAGRQYGIADRDINLRLYSIAGSDGLDALEAAGKSANGLLNN